MLYADISLNLPLNSTFVYEVPSEFEKSIKKGQRVEVSFLKSPKKMGIVVKLHHNKPSFKCKAIGKLYDDFFTIPSYAELVTRFMSDYYACFWNECLHLFAPVGFVSTKMKEHFESLTLPPFKNDFNLKLSAPQEDVYQAIKSNSENFSKFHTGLLLGVTGSGKTEIYQKIAQDLLAHKKQTLILLPEIALTVQTIQRFSHLFGSERIGIVHSRLTPQEKLVMFYKISTGLVSVIIGPRSALFSPFKNLSAIILDEEQDSSYKSQKSPRYQTKQIAYKIAQYLNIVFIMGSATPSLETFYASLKNKITLYKLMQRFHDVSLPKVTVMELEYSKNMISEGLVKKILQTKKDGNQSIIFLNRRGYSPFVVCDACGLTQKCPDCSISLTYHKKENELLCHYCHYSTPFKKECSACLSKSVFPQSVGTERLQEEIEKAFFQLKILRMDKDTVKDKKENYQQIIEDFKNNKADVLIGTRMVAKGLDFPNVTLVGVLSCDIALNMPDFRSAENTFSLITQVAGRAGRKSQGEVILQTQYKDHYSVKLALKQDYESFFHQEINFRKEYFYPPFVHIIRFVIRSTDSDTALKKSKVLATHLNEKFPNIKLIGPSTCVVEKIATYYRHHIIIKVKDPQKYGASIKNILKELNNKGNYHIECDVDPISFL